MKTKMTTKKLALGGMILAILTLFIGIGISSLMSRANEIGGGYIGGYGTGSYTGVYLGAYVLDGKNYPQGTEKDSMYYMNERLISKINSALSSKAPNGCTGGTLRNPRNSNLANKMNAKFWSAYDDAMSHLNSDHKRVVGIAMTAMSDSSGYWNTGTVPVEQLRSTLRNAWNSTYGSWDNADAWNGSYHGATYAQTMVTEWINTAPDGTQIIVLVADDSFPQLSYTFDATTKIQPPSDLSSGSSTSAIKDSIITTVDNASTIQGDTVNGSVTLHFQNRLGADGGSSTKSFSGQTPGTTFDSPDFLPSDLGMTTWESGTYWFTLHIDALPHSSNHKTSGIDVNDRLDDESTTLQPSPPGDGKKELYDGANTRKIDESKEQLTYDMEYYSRIYGAAIDKYGIYIRDTIHASTSDVKVDDAHVTDEDGNAVQADITTNGTDEIVVTAHVSETTANTTYVLHVRTTPIKKSATAWDIPDSGDYSYDGTNWSKPDDHDIPVVPHDPDKVWVSSEDGALTAYDPSETNDIKDIENGHSDTKIFLMGESIGAVVNGTVRKEYVNNLKSYVIYDDITESMQYIDWDVSKTKVFVDGKDDTDEFTIKRDGNRIVAIAGDAFLNDSKLKDADREVKLYIQGTVKAVGEPGEKIKLLNGANEDINGEAWDTNLPWTFVWQPAPDKAWVKYDFESGTWDAVIDPDGTNAVGGDDQTFLDGDILGSVVNGQIPADLAVAPSSLVLTDDWTQSDYLVDPQDVENVRIYVIDLPSNNPSSSSPLDVRSKSEVDDIVNNPDAKDVTDQFSISYDSTDLTQANKVTAVAKDSYLATLTNMSNALQITMLVPMKADYANGGGADQVRQDYGAGANDTVTMTDAPDGTKFSNVASETLGSSTVETNVPWIHGYVPASPVKDVTVVVDGDSINEQEVALNSYFNYKLMSSSVSSNRAYPMTAWGITDQLDEQYDQFTGQWVVEAMRDVYDSKGNLLFKQGDVINESVAYHNAQDASSSNSMVDETADDDDESDSASSNTAKDADSNKNANESESDDMIVDTDDENTDTTSNTASNTNDADEDTNSNESTDEKDSSNSSKTTGVSTNNDELTMDERVATYETGKKTYFTATYSDGKFEIVATQDFLDLINKNTGLDNEYQWVAYIQCERTWVTERHENFFTEKVNDNNTDSNIVWTSTPEHPAIDVEKYDTASGPDEGDRDEKEQSLMLENAEEGTEITFVITNTGDVPLVNVTLDDETVDGTGKVEDITFPADWDGNLDVGESVTATGVLRGVEAGTTHTDTATAKGQSYYTGQEVQDQDDWNGEVQALPQTGDTLPGILAGVIAVAATGATLVRHRK